MNKTEICSKALERWGHKAQAVMLMGECGELIASLNRHFNQGRELEDEVIDELADVFILAEQMTIILGRNRVNERVVTKLQRLKDRLDNVLDHHGDQE